MSNHASKHVTRMYAWQYAGFQEHQAAAGEQARAEQGMRRQDRPEYVNGRKLRRFGHIMKKHVMPGIIDSLYKDPLFERLAS